MLLNRWYWYVMLVGTLQVKPIQCWSQIALKPLAELDRLTTWYPVRQPVPPRFQSTISVQPHTYTNLDDLIQKVKAGSKVEALNIDSNVLKDGHLDRLRQLTNVRVLHINLNESILQPIDSLFQAVQDWPELERLSISVNSSFSTKTERNQWVVLPANIRRFSKLSEVQLSGSNVQWNASLNVLADLKTLRQLTLTNWQPNDEQLIQFVALPQLVGLKLGGPGFMIKPETFAELGHLKALTLFNTKVDTTTFQRTLNRLSNLESLSIESVSLSKGLLFSELKNLKTLELTNDYGLSIESATFTGLSTLEHLVIHSSLGGDLSALCSLTQLRTLLINGQGKSVKAADCIGQLNQLTELRLERMTLDRLPMTTNSWRQLRKLSLYHCGLDSLPPAVGRLPMLEELNLEGNKLQQVPDLSQLRTLQRLTLANNQLTGLPEALGQLSQLTLLNVSSNRLTQLPASFGRLTKLRTLTAFNNKLERLPDDLGKLRKLQTLSLQDNQLVNLPVSLGQLDSLQKLFIGNNRLKNLPSTLDGLKRLTELQIGKNELIALPTSIGGLTALTNLTLESNPLTELPASFSELRNLQFLTIMGTQLRLLPDNIGALTKLISVTLNNNELIALPNSIGGWQNVTDLSLNRNRLEGLPNAIGRLSKLMNLQISGRDEVNIASVGGLQQLPDSIVYCTQLWQLTLSRQPQLDANDVFTKAIRLKNLTHLKITESNVSRLPDIDWKEVRWQVLVLNQNLLTELPVGVLDAPLWQTIAVSQNRLPESLNRDFHDKETLLVSFVESGMLPMERLPKPSRKVAFAYQQLSMQKAQQRDWVGTLADLDKAVDYAPDTTRALVYGQRASFHFFRKEYPEALVDYDKAIAYAPQLRKDKFSDSLTAKRTVISFWQQKAAVLGITGQYDAALLALAQAETLLPSMDNTPLSGLVHTERGRYLAMKNKFVEADSSYSKAIRAYEKLPYADPGTKLTVVELSLLTAQYDRAQRAIANIPTEQLRDGRGFDLLKEYLKSCLTVLKGEEEGTKVMDRLTAYLSKHPSKIYGWSFDLFDNWLNRAKLPTDKITVLRQLTDATKERLVKPQ